MSAATLLGALAATGALISIGAVLRQLLRYSEPFWRDLERLAYTLLLPCLFIHGLATADFGDVPIALMATVLLTASVLAAGVTVAARRLLVPGLRDAGDPAAGRRFTSVFQGAVRFNNYVGLVIATALYGGRGTALAALTNAILVPLVNVTSAAVLVRYGSMDDRADDPEGAPEPSVLRAILTNPLVVACAVGVALHLAAAPLAGMLRAGPMPALMGTLEMITRNLGQAALPIGLLCVGAGLRGDLSWRSQARDVLSASAIRFGVLPATTYGLCRLVGLTGPAATVAVLFQCLPTASSAYVLARRLGGDADVMATIIAAQTVAAAVTIPAWLLLAHGL